MNSSQLPVNSLHIDVYFIISFQDVELAETFLNRCEPTDSVARVNHFFRMCFAQLDTDTRDIRSLFNDNLDRTSWLTMFKRDVLPLLLKHRFMPDTRRECQSFYQYG